MEDKGVKRGLGVVEGVARDESGVRVSAGNKVRVEVDNKEIAKCKLPQIVDYRF